MRVVLPSKKKLRFLVGTLVLPEETNHISLSWDTSNTIVMSWLTNSIEDKKNQSVLWMKTTHGMWTELRNKYHQGDVFGFQTFKEMYSPSIFSNIQHF